MDVLNTYKMSYLDVEYRWKVFKKSQAQLVGKV